MPIVTDTNMLWRIFTPRTLKSFKLNSLVIYHLGVCMWFTIWLGDLHV